MSAHEDRRAELIAGAVAGDLTDDERAELADLAASDSTVDAEIDDFRRLVDRMSDASPRLPWIETSSDEVKRPVMPSGRRARSAVLAAAAVTGIAVGAGAVLGFDAFADREVTGPPGTLGAYEQLDFEEIRAGIEIDGGLVAHTWGTETILEMDGIPDAGAYEVFVVQKSGTALASGTFLGSTVTIDCRMNAAVLREDVTGVEIRASDGSILAVAEVPATV